MKLPASSAYFSPILVNQKIPDEIRTFNVEEKPTISVAFKTKSQAILTKGCIECEAPSDRLDQFNGIIVLEKLPFTAHTFIHEDSVPSSV